MACHTPIQCPASFSLFPIAWLLIRYYCICASFCPERAAAAVSSWRICMLLGTAAVAASGWMWLAIAAVFGWSAVHAQQCVADLAAHLASFLLQLLSNSCKLQFPASRWLLQVAGRFLQAACCFLQAAAVLAGIWHSRALLWKALII